MQNFSRLLKKYTLNNFKSVAPKEKCLLHLDITIEDGIYVYKFLTREMNFHFSLFVYLLLFEYYQETFHHRFSMGHYFQRFLG